MSVTIKLKRAYDPQSVDDGFRIYIDRLWPRGLSHETFHYNLWDKEIAPSTQLREWFHSDIDARWDAFAEKYKAELRQNPAFAALRSEVYRHPVVTLLFSSRNPDENNAVVVRELLQES